jgi:hypothetical protein
MRIWCLDQLLDVRCRREVHLIRFRCRYGIWRIFYLNMRLASTLLVRGKAETYLCLAQYFRAMPNVLKSADEFEDID